MKNLPSIAIVAAVFGVALGLGLGWALRDDFEAPARTDFTPAVASAGAASQPGQHSFDRTELDALRNDLEFARDARIALADEIDRLRDELEVLQGNRAETQAATTDGSSPQRDPSSDGDPSPVQAAVAEVLAQAAKAAATGEPWFNAVALRRAGMSGDDIERLQTHYESKQLEELYLNDNATREGWLGTRRYRRERRKLREELRDELGDDDYDWILFASGRSNRVRIDSVLRDSPASDAGIQAGDVIVRYDGQPILHPYELQKATTEGEPGEIIMIEALRGGEPIQLYVPRGPLGTKLGRVKQALDAH